MTPELAQRLALAYPDMITATGVAHVAGVAAGVRYASKPQSLRPLRPLHTQKNPRENEDVADAIEERSAIIADTCPIPYADTFARLNHQKPLVVSLTEWERAVNDAGLFLDVWGERAVEQNWSASDLFDVPRNPHPGGLIWRLKGEHVEILDADQAHISNRRILQKRQANV